MKAEAVVDLTADEEEIQNTDEIQVNSLTYSPPENFESSSDINFTSIEDVTYAIKENLDNENYLPASIINQLHNLENLEGLFISLSKELNLQEVTEFGKSLISNNINNESIVAYFVKYLLLEKVKCLYIKINYFKNVFHILGEC